MTIIVSPNLSSSYLVDEKLAYAKLSGENRSTNDSFSCPDLINLRPIKFSVSTSTLVLSWCDRFKVLRTNAARIAAKMVNYESVRDRPNLLFVNGPMRAYIASAYPHSTVSLLPSFDSCSEYVAMGRKSKIDFFKVGICEARARSSIAMRSCIDSLFAAAADTKTYLFHRSSLLRRVAQGASGSLVRVAPFYVMPTALEGGENA